MGEGLGGRRGVPSLPQHVQLQALLAGTAAGQHGALTAYGVDA